MWDAGAVVSIPGSGRSPGGGNGKKIPSILAWKIPWKEKPGGLQSIGSQRVGHDEHACMGIYKIDNQRTYCIEQGTRLSTS